MNSNEKSVSTNDDRGLSIIFISKNNKNKYWNITLSAFTWMSKLVFHTEVKKKDN